MTETPTLRLDDSDPTLANPADEVDGLVIDGCHLAPAFPYRSR